MQPMAQYRFQVQVEPGYLPEQSAPSRGRYTFSYTITIRNTGDVAAQLVSRHWDIEDAEGGMQTVDGLGWWGISRCCSRVNRLNTPAAPNCTPRTA